MARKNRKLNAEDRFNSNRPSADEVLNIAVDDEDTPEGQEPEETTAEPEAKVDEEAPVQQEQPGASDENDKSEGFKKTSTGYVRADGTEMKRKTMFFTEDQWRRLQTDAIQAGHGTSTSAYVIDALGLDDE